MHCPEQIIIMNKFKILYCKSKEITLSTKVNRAYLEKLDFYKLSDKENGDIIFNDIKNVEFFKWNGIGSYIRIVNGNDTYILTVPRIFLNIGDGFAVINSFAVKRLYNDLKGDL